MQINNNKYNFFEKSRLLGRFAKLPQQVLLLSHFSYFSSRFSSSSSRVALCNDTETFFFNFHYLGRLLLYFDKDTSMKFRANKILCQFWLLSVFATSVFANIFSSFWELYECVWVWRANMERSFRILCSDFLGGWWNERLSVSFEDVKTASRCANCPGPLRSRCIRSAAPIIC